MAMNPVTVTPLPWTSTVGTTLDAILAATPTNATILITDTQTLTTSRALPATCTLKVIKPGFVVIPTGTTFTIAGAIDAGQYKIFECQGTGAVAFSSTSVRDFWVRWWGTTGAGVANDTSPINAAFAAFSSLSGTLNFSPGDTHLIDNLTWTVSGANIAEAGQRIKFNEVTFKSNLSSSADMLTIVNAVNQQIHLEGPVQFKGFADYVWSKSGTGAVASLYFNAASGAGTVGTERATLLEVVADKNWYYDAVGDVLYVYVVAGTDTYRLTESHYPYIQIANAGAALTGWTKYFGGSAIVSNLCNFTADKVFGRGVDNVLHLAGGEVGVTENIMGNFINTVIKCTTAGGNKPVALTLRNTRAQNSFGDIISADSGDSITIDGLANDYALGRIMNIANVEALSLRNIPLEVVGYGGVVTEGFLFSAVKGIDISGCNLTQGVYDAEDYSNCSRIMYFTNGCGGVKIHGNQIIAGAHRVGSDRVYFYDHDGTLGGMDITGNYVEGQLCPESPVATIGNCSYNGTTAVTMPLHYVHQADGRSLTNYMGATALHLTNPGLVGCTKASVTGLGGADTALEITWTNATNSVNWVSLFTSVGLSGTKYGVLSFKYKGSIAQNINFTWMKTGSATYATGYFKVAAGSQQRTAFLPGPVNDFAVSATVNEIYFTSTASSETFTMDDDFQVYWFNTRGEAEAFVGKYGATP